VAISEFPAMYEHPEFAHFIAGLEAHFTAWRQRWSGNAEPQLGSLRDGAELGLGAPRISHLKALKPACHPKSVIAELGESLLEHYTGKPLIAKYDVYQHLMDYWAVTMQDDCYLIAADGWKADTYRIMETDKKGKQKDKGWACDLVPKALIVARYFAKEQSAIDTLTAEVESLAAQMTELEEEHGGEEGLFAELDKVNKAEVTKRLKEISGNAKPQLGSLRTHAELGLGAPGIEDDEAATLNAWLKLSNDEAEKKKALKEAESKLDALAYARYPKLSEAEIKTLVVDDKWLAALAAAVHGEMDRISQALTRRVKELAERYETPMPHMAKNVAELGAKVNRHLEKMGFEI